MDFGPFEFGGKYGIARKNGGLLVYTIWNATFDIQSVLN